MSVRTFPAPRTARRAAAARFARWGLLCLEDRVTPTLNVWTGLAGDGLWSSANNWSNLHSPASDEDAVINTPVTVTHNAGDDTVHSLAVTTGATLNLSGGSITDATTLDAPAGDSHFNLAGGTLAGAAVTAGSTIAATTTNPGTLSGLTLAGTLDVSTDYNVRVRVTGGLTLNNGTVLLGSPAGTYYGLLQFDGGSQALSGTGTVVLGASVYSYLQAGPAAGSALTIGPGVVVRGHSGGIGGFHPYWGGAADATFTNQGTIRADGAGGAITLGGANWTNAGSVQAAGGGITLAGSWTNSGTIKSAGDASAIAASPTGATESGNTVTITTAAAHGFTVGQGVTIAGVGVAGYNGAFTIASVPSATTFTYTAGATGLGDSGGGTATLNSTLNLGGTFATATLGTVTSSGGTINLTGALTNTGHTLALDAATGPWQLVGGTIDGGTVTTTGGAQLVGTNSVATLANGVTLAGTLDLTRDYNVRARVTGGLTLNNGTVLLGGDAGTYGLLQFDGGSQTLGGTGTVVFGASVYSYLQAGPAAGSALTIGPGVTVRGHSGGIGGSHFYWGGGAGATFTNQGTVRADGAAGETVTLGGTDWTNAGTVEAAGGTVTLAGSWTNSGTLSVATSSALNLAGTFTTAGLGSLTNAGTVNLVGTLNNTGDTLTLNGTTGSFQLLGGTVTGGTVATLGGTALVGTTSEATLSGVTLGGTLDLTRDYTVRARVTGGLTLAGGTVLLGSDAGVYAFLRFDGGSQTLGGTGTVVLGASVYNFLQAGPAAGSALTIGPGVTVRGHSGGIGYHFYWGGPADATFTNQGTIRADVAGGAITLGGANWSNAGSVEAQNGGTITAQGTTTNFAGGTLTGGTWKASAGSTLRLIGGNITTNAADIILDGAGSNFFSDAGTADALTGLNTNAAAGSLTIQNGRNLTVYGRFDNAGTLTIGAGSTLSVQHPYASSVVGFSSQYTTTSWSAAQAVGLPNTPGYGDYPTSWAPSPENGTQEFLTLGFAAPDFADGVVIRETQGTGFVTRVDAIDTADVAHTVWTGVDPSAAGTAADFVAAWPRTAYRVKAVTIFVDTNHNLGTWEEIDAVQLVGAATGINQTGGHTAVAAGGTLALPVGTFAQAGGSTTLNGTLSAPLPVAIQGGLLEGTGTVAADLTNAGIVAPGPGLGTLTVTGNYTQTAAGTLAIDVGGTGAGQTDRLNVGGAVALAGALNVGSVNGYFAAVGDTVTVLDPTGPGPIAGTFAGIPAVGGTLDSDGPTTFAVTYAGSGNDVALTAINRAPTLDAIPDPAPTLEDPGTLSINLSGIGTGNVEPQALTVTATSDNPALIPDPTVSYTSPNATGSLAYTPASHTNGTAHITVTVTDNGGTANGGINTFSRTFTVTVVELNDAPTLDPIPDPAAIPEDSGQQTINLTGISAGPNESQTLTVTATSSNPAVIPNPTVTYTGPDATGSLAYTPVANANGTAVITVTVKDDGGTLLGGVDTFTRTFTVTVTPVPDAPTLDTDPLTVLPPVPVRTKLTPDPLGTLVADLIAGKSTDADGDVVGIAITGLDPANTITKGVPKFGVWQFTTDGTNWLPVPTAIPAGKALVLSADATTRVRFLPNLKFQGLSWFTFLAWDHTDDPSGTAAGTTVDTTPTAYSAAAERAWVAVGKTRPAVTATGATVLAAVREDAKGSRVFPVKTLLGLAGLENPSPTSLGVAITGLSTATGTWQYRLAKTKTFITIDPTVNATNALLLRPTDSLKFVPAANANGAGDLTFKTWVPDGAFGTYATDTTVAGFGRDSGAASISITAVNDAPVLAPTLHPDFGTVSAGQTTAPITVGTLLASAPAGAITDIDSTGLGIQLMPASSKAGKWFYSIDGTTFLQLKTPKLLGPNVELRFQAAAGATGTLSLAFKAWDGKLLSKAGTISLTIG